MAVRQQDVSGAMMSILKKMDVMVESTQQTYEESLIVLSSVEAVMKNDVATELKKQTSILMSIETKIGQAQLKETVGGDPARFRDLLGGLSVGLDKIIAATQKLDEKAGEKLNNFFTKLTETLGNFSKQFNAENAKSLTSIIETIGTGVLRFGAVLALYSIIAPFAMIGATLFGLTLRLLMKTTGEIDPNLGKSVVPLLALGWDILYFGAALALYSIISPLALLGATMFGLTVRLLQATAGTVDEASLKAMASVKGLAESSLLFGIGMALYAVISPLAMIGAVMFGLTIRLLQKTAGTVDESTMKSMVVVNGLAKSTILFGLSMALYSIISPLAMIGAVMFGLTINLLMKSAGVVNESDVKAMAAVNGLAKSTILFGLGMALYAVISPLAMIGATMFGLTVRLLMKSAGTVDEQSLESVYLATFIGKNTLLFGIAMALYAVISPLAMIGTVMFGLTVRLLMKSAGTVDEQALDSIYLATLIGKGALFFGIAMAIYAVISPLAMVGAVMFGLTVRLLLLSAGTANPQSIEAMNSVLAIAKGALLFGLAMAIYAVISPVAMIGAVMFGLSVRLLLLSAGTANPQSIEAMKSVLVLAKGALLFGLSMVLFAVMSPIAMVGAVMFGLSVRLLLLSAGTANPQSIEAMKSVLTLAKGVLLFGIALAIYVILAPFAMIGAVLFGLTVRLLLMTAGTANQGAIDAMNSVLNLAKGVLLFGFAMVIFTILAPIAMIGAILFGLTIRLLLFAMGTAKKEGTDAMNSVLTLAKGILLFTLAMVVVTLLAPIVLIGALIMTGVLFLLSFALRAMGTKDVKRGVTSLVILGFAIILFGLAILAFNLLVTAQSAIFTLVVVAGFALLLYGIGKFGKELQKGAIALGIMAISIIILGVALMIFKAANLTLLDAVILGAIVVGLGLAMSSFGAEAALIIEGSVAMMAAAIPLILISVALLIFKATKFTAEDGIVLGAVVVGLGLAMAAAGLASILIGAGAIAMGLAGVSLIVLSVGIGIFKLMDFKKEDATAISSAIDSVANSMTSAGASSILIALGAVAIGLASIALLPLTAALAIFKSSGFTKEDGDSLEYGLSAVINGFLGGKFPGGIVEGLKFAGQAAARAALLTITVPAMVGAGVALIAISKGLTIFKASGFTTEDGVVLESTIGSIAKAFTLVTDKKRQKELGINIDPVDLMIGIMSLSMAGNVLSSLAQGVQAWAKLEVNEYEVVNPGTSKAKLVIKARRKLNEGDFETAANGMAKVIGAIAEPFALVGRLEKGQPSGNPIYDAIFGGGFVSAGIAALKHSGDTIVSLAQGVQAFATMQYTEYEVVNAGTSKAKLVPKGIIKLGEAEISAASKNIAMVIGVVAEAFAKVGKNEASSEGIFSGGFVSKGVKALSGVGDNLKSMVDSVLMMANREIPTFTLINGGTKDAKLVPGNPRKITDPQLFAAADTIMKILKVIANGFYDIGKAESDSSSFWGDGYITKGIKALSGVGDIVAKVTDSVIKIATGTITPMVASGSGTDTKLVPGTPIKITDAMLKSAAKTINSIMMIIGAGIYNVGVFYKKYQDPIDQAIDVLPNMSKSISKLAEGVVSFAELKDIDKSTTNFKLFTGAVFSIFDPAMNKGLPQKLEYMDKFTANIVTMAAPKNQLDKVATNFDKIQKSMKLFQGHVNGMDLVKLTATDSMMKSLAIMSKSPEVVGEKIAESIEKAFKDLLEGIKKINDSSTAAAAAAPIGEAGTPPAGPKKPGAPAGKPTPGAPAGKPGASISARDIQSAMVSALNSVTINTRVVKY
jgi:hypothetical protein